MTWAFQINRIMIEKLQHWLYPSIPIWRNPFFPSHLSFRLFNSKRKFRSLCESVSLLGCDWTKKSAGFVGNPQERDNNRTETMKWSVIFLLNFRIVCVLFVDIISSMWTDSCDADPWNLHLNSFPRYQSHPVFFSYRPLSFSLQQFSLCFLFSLDVCVSVYLNSDVKFTDSLAICNIVLSISHLILTETIECC